MLSEGESVTFSQLCSGNPTNAGRTSDKFGQGYYGASRGGRTHGGVDVKCADGATVYAPFDLTINRRSAPYTDPKKRDINDGLMVTTEGVCFQIWYVKPVKTSGTLRRGEKMGTLLPMQSVYPGITSHVHVQRCDKSDPSNYF
ncbi:leukocyte cell-derived chemotaxin-2-like [Aplochiton taeniatus]